MLGQSISHLKQVEPVNFEDIPHLLITDRDVLIRWVSKVFVPDVLYNLASNMHSTHLAFGQHAQR